MGSATAGTWFIGILIYFVIFFIVMGQAVQISDSVSHTGGSFNVGESNEQCMNPREAFGVGIQRVNPERTRFCYNTLGFNDENICNQISGCSWQNETTGFWFWEQTTDIQFCSGELNFTHFGTTFADIVATSGSICEMESIRDDPFMCRALACTWGIPENEIETGQQNFFAIVGGLFTFNVDLGIPSGFNALFVLIFFYLPFTILLVALYFSLPFIH